MPFKLAENIHLKLSHYTDDGKLITVAYIPATYNHSKNGPVIADGSNWLSFLHLPDGRTEHCRMPFRLLDQRLREDKERMAKERKEYDVQAIIAAKVKKAEGFGL